MIAQSLFQHPLKAFQWPVWQSPFGESAYTHITNDGRVTSHKQLSTTNCRHCCKSYMVFTSSRATRMWFVFITEMCRNLTRHFDAAGVFTQNNISSLRHGFHRMFETFFLDPGLCGPYCITCFLQVCQLHVMAANHILYHNHTKVLLLTFVKSLSF